MDVLVILPEAGQLETIQEGMSADLLDQVRAQAEIHDVTLNMPKFDLESEINLADLLKEVGMMGKTWTNGQLTMRTMLLKFI